MNFAIFQRHGKKRIHKMEPSNAAITLDFLLSGLFIITSGGTTFCVDSEYNVCVVLFKDKHTKEIVQLIPTDMGIKEFVSFCNINVSKAMKAEMEAMLDKMSKDLKFNA